jgi:hypothetical protein
MNCQLLCQSYFISSLPENFRKINASRNQTLTFKVYSFRKQSCHERFLVNFMDTKMKTITKLGSKMKRFVILLMMGVALSFLQGCSLDNEDYSVENAWIGFGIVNKDASSNLTTIAMDDGEVLYPVEKSGYWSELVDNQRVLLNFTIIGNKSNADHNEEYYVKINSLRKILYKGILDITPAIEDSIGNDPIKVKDHWVKGNLLNFELQYWGGNKIHYINLVKQPGVVTDANGSVELELRHNENADNENYPLSAIVTFDLSSLRISGKTSTPFKVKVKGFDGENFEFVGEYKY